MADTHSPARPHRHCGAIARDIPEGWLVNLGIGIPTLVADLCRRIAR